MVRRLLKDFRFSVLPVPGRLIAIIFFIMLSVIPLLLQHPYYLRMFVYANIFIIFAVSWDLLSGYTGQLNFGHALFFGVAAYSSALMWKFLGWQPWATIPLSVLASVAVGVITCFPALRLRGSYLALLTMAFPLMLIGIVLALKNYTGAEHGIMGIPGLAATLTQEYYIVLVVMLASVLIMWKLTDAGSKYVRTGLIFHAIREDEIAARATGINTIRYKLLAFAIGGFFAGLAGVLYAHVAEGVDISTLNLTMSFTAVIWVVFGGIVSIYGSVVGVYILYPLVYLSSDIERFFGGAYAAAAGNQPAVITEFLRVMQRLTGRPILVLSILVIVILLFMPRGLAVQIHDKIERECPRCKLTNVAWRKECRACGASLR
jgi:branched-chain amino acid transport system permease protein